MKRKIKPAGTFKYFRYSYSFKKQVLEEIENGLISINQASKKYKISRSALQTWLTRMGNTEKRIRALQGMSPKEKIRDMEARVKRLEKEKEILKFAMDMISEEVGTDMVKKYLPESQEVIRRKKKRS
jgi:transposase-like protein